MLRAFSCIANNERNSKLTIYNKITTFVQLLAFYAYGIKLFLENFVYEDSELLYNIYFAGTKRVFV